MVSKSYSNLLDLNFGDSMTFSRGGKKFSRVATIAGVLSELDDENRSTIGSDVPSSISQERMIIVGNQHPLGTHRRLDVEMGWDFSWDEDSLLLQLKDGLRQDAENAGVSYQSKRGYIGLEYYGRTVSIKILPVGIHMGYVHSVLGLLKTEAKVPELQNKFKVRDGMILIPYEYVVCKKGIDNLHETLGLNPSAPKKSMLVVSKFIGCSPSLSGAIRVNPWNIYAVAEAMDSALTILDLEKQM
ncbi:alpha,alpha-trehalose-phosphate synthase [UDP-forming] 5-like [Olea europaea subsp. europaea]|uniref:Alpha,alpha-trehalose-phosphate synthase [UDP-forming] 5-like n=1 Tax=Olea europaea subsp. europaea TaxID=158383 RepID=A0A8S0T395_OLEEU|nr:alpha,alpha-trehalose-phosphate synthase [UDP-forming] 5-like [Olea europaea subsp. europaea]